MNDKVLIAIIIAVAVIIVVFILRRSLKSGKLKVGRLAASVESDRPAAKTRADASGAEFGSENELTVAGDTEANMREMKAGNKNKFSIGESPKG